MTLVHLIEALYPSLEGTIITDEPFPCPLTMHFPDDGGEMVVSNWNGEQVWKCTGGCAGDEWKDGKQFIVQAMGLGSLTASHLFLQLTNLADHEERVCYIEENWPHWFTAGKVAP